MYEIRAVPLHVRKRKAALALIATLGLSGWALWVVVSENQLGWTTLGLVPFVLVGLWVSYRYWTTTETQKIKAAARPSARASNSNLSPLDKIWAYGTNTFGVLLLLAGFGIFALQVFAYLKSGEWPELPLKLLVAFGPAEFQAWIDSPSDWLGVHRIVNGLLELVPLSLCSLAVGVWMAAYEIKSDFLTNPCSRRAKTHAADG